MYHIKSKLLSHLLTLAAVALLVASCAGDGAEAPEADNSAQPIGYGWGKPRSAPWRDGRLPSGNSGRAGSTVDPPTPVIFTPQTIGVYGFIEGVDEALFNNQKMWWRDGVEIANCGFDWSNWPAENDWPYDPPKYWEFKYRNKNYLFYAYAPHTDSSALPTISNVNLSYEKFKGMTFDRVRPMDVREQLAATLPWRDKSGEQPQFVMEHMTARLRLAFTVGELYDQIRDIRVRDVKVHDLVNGNYWTYVLDTSGDALNVTINSSESIDDPSTEPLSLMPEFEPDATGLPGLAIGYDMGYRAFGSVYLVPQEVAALVVTVVYDVYDHTGLLTREEQSATNTIPLYGLGTLRRGYFYDLRIAVSPAYLYVLSDNDVAPDGLIDIKE